MNLSQKGQERLREIFKSESLNEQVIYNYFEFARDRHQAYLNRRAGLPRGEWTDNPIIREQRFCNIFREYDRLTEYYLNHIVPNYSGTFRELNQQELIFATTFSRIFNNEEFLRAVGVIRLDDPDKEKERILGIISDRLKRKLPVYATAYYTYGCMSYKTGTKELDSKAHNTVRGMFQDFVPKLPDITWKILGERDLYVARKHLMGSFRGIGDFISMEVLYHLTMIPVDWINLDINSWMSPGIGPRIFCNYLFKCNVGKETLALYSSSKTSGTLITIYKNWDELCRLLDIEVPLQDDERINYLVVENIACEASKYHRFKTYGCKGGRKFLPRS